MLDTSPALGPSLPRLPVHPLGAATTAHGSSSSNCGSPRQPLSTAAHAPSAPVTPRKQDGASLFSAEDWRSSSPSSQETGQGSPAPVRSGVNGPVQPAGGSAEGNGATHSVGSAEGGGGLGTWSLRGGSGVVAHGGREWVALAPITPTTRSRSVSLRGSEGGDWGNAQPLEYGDTGSYVADSRASSPYTVASGPGAGDNVFV